MAKPALVNEWTSAILPDGLKGRSTRWAVFRCTSCDYLVLAKAGAIWLEPSITGYDSPREAGYSEIHETFPSTPAASDTIPELPRRYLQQAMDTLSAPDACAVMCASSIDGMLKERGLTEGALHDRIVEAEGSHLLTKEMAALAHKLRTEGNRVRHADFTDPHVSTAEARVLLDIAMALGDFLFVYPARLESYEQRAAARRSK
jgi:hypothetical protein